MHELSLCEAVARRTLAHAAGRDVRSVRLQIGHLRQVSPPTLDFCWGIATEGTPLASTVLDVEHVAATVRCRECDESTVLVEPILRCGSCGGTTVDLDGGDEFLIESIELAAPASTGVRP